MNPYWRTYPEAGYPPVCVTLRFAMGAMPHGDYGDARFSGCDCSHCALTRSFLAFRDSGIPERRAAITNRREAAVFLLFMAGQVGTSSRPRK
jgi:hypothetical protein